MNDFFQALEIPVVHILLDEVRPRPLVYVAHGGGLKRTVEQWRKLFPLQRIRIGRSARAVEKGPYSQIEEGQAQGIRRISKLVRLILAVVRQCQLLGETDKAGR